MKGQWLALAAAVLSCAAVMAALFCVASGTGSEAVHAAAARVDPTVSGVEPWSAANDLDTPIVISGTGFTAVPTVYLGSTLLDDVGWVSGERLTAMGPGHTAALLAELARQASKDFSQGMPLKELGAFNLRRFDNLCALVRAVPAYLLHMSREGAFWEEIEGAILQRAASAN